MSLESASRAEIHTAQELIEYINYTFSDPSVINVEAPDGTPLNVAYHKENVLTDGSLTHDLVLSDK